MTIVCVPAYGRDYASVKEVKAAWAANKDFFDLVSQRYVNKQDAETAGLSVMVRYSKLRKVTAV